jgi:hypothetical protein
MSIQRETFKTCACITCRSLEFEDTSEYKIVLWTDALCNEQFHKPSLVKGTLFRSQRQINSIFVRYIYIYIYIMHNYLRYLNKRNVVLMSFTSVNVTQNCRQTKGSNIFLSSPNLLSSLISSLSVRYTLYIQQHFTLKYT